MIPFPTTPIPDDPAPPVMHRHDVTVSGSSILSHLGDAFKQVFDFGLLWDIIVQWCRSLRDSVPAWLPAVPGEDPPPAAPGTGNPGHGASKVAINFWFFLGIYYGFYNLIGLLFIQKVFNMYSLNWYPSRMSFATSFSLANLLPLGVGSILYYFLPGPIIANNLTWIFLTFATMCTPLLVALLVLLFQRKHNQLGGFRGLTETQLLFTTPSPSRGRYFSGRARRRWQRDPGCFRLARSYRRFLWLCSALLLSLIGYVLGEAYAELYLQTLPHSSLETIVYVYSWVLTIYTLDGTTGWILGAKVHSYPLQFVFKLYFSLTYQTYVRALYARLRSPSQFAYLQLLSSSIVIVWNPICMTPTYHSLLVWLRINGQPYEDWKKNVGRAFFLRGLAESISMIAFLGWCIVLHFGWNTKIYPYFSFKDSNDEYTFELTFWASLATWGCEMAAGWVVRRVMRLAFGFRVTQEAVRDFGVYPELLPACLWVFEWVSRLKGSFFC